MVHGLSTCIGKGSIRHVSRITLPTGLEVGPGWGEYPIEQSRPRAHSLAMQSAAIDPPVVSSDGEIIPVFSVVIAYEDFTTGKQAKRAADFLVANLSHEWQVTSQMWKFEVLSIPELREMAAKDAAMADLIIVSSHGDDELPADVKGWVEMWRGHEGGAGALVAFFDRPPEHAGHAQVTHAYLEGVAKRGQMEFFAWPEVGSGKGSRQELLVLDRPWEMTGDTSVPLAAVASREESFSHRRINE